MTQWKTPPQWLSTILTDTISPTDRGNVQSWWFTLFATFIVILCITTRFVTGFHASGLFNASRQRDSGDGVSIPKLQPYWIPWFGHTFQFTVGWVKWLRTNVFTRSVSERRRGVVALQVLGKRVNVVGGSLGLREQAFSALSSRDVSARRKSIFRILTNLYGDRGAMEKSVCGLADGGKFWDEYVQILSAFAQEPFVDPTIRRLTRAVEDQIWNLLSGNESWVDQEWWERNARTEVLAAKHSPDNDGTHHFVAEVDLFVLLRDWVGQISVTQFLGAAFMQVNPRFLEDMWLVDGKMHHFLLGLPSVIVPGLLPAYFGRERIIAAVTRHHEAVARVMNDEDPDTGYDDLGDVSQIIWDLVRLQKGTGVSLRSMAVSTMAVLFSSITDSTRLVFWLIYYIYREPNLLAAVRNELRPFVKLQKSENEGFSITEAPRVVIDSFGLMNNIPLSKSLFREVARLEVTPFVYEELDQDLTLLFNGSDNDTRLEGKLTLGTYRLKKGDVLCIPGLIHQHDATYFSDPTKFNPRRFMVAANDTGENGTDTEANLQTLHSFQGVKNICDNQGLIEQQVLTFVAAIVMTWDIDLADIQSSAADAKSKDLGHHFSVGTAFPSGDLRAKMSRRQW